MAKHDPKKWKPDFSRYVGRGYVSKKLFKIYHNKYLNAMEVLFMLTQKSPYGGLQYLHCKLSRASAEFWSERLKPGMQVLVQGKLYYEKQKTKNKRWQVHVMSLDVFDSNLYRRDSKEMEKVIEEETIDDQIMIIDTSHERKF